MWSPADVRALLLLLVLGVPGCAGAPVFGRGLVDVGVSGLAGRDCSIMRLDRGQTYCAPRDPSQRQQPYCTRSLGTVDCWADPGLVAALGREVGDTPPPTPEQLRYRAAPWPKSLTF